VTMCLGAAWAQPACLNRPLIGKAEKFVKTAITNWSASASDSQGACTMSAFARLAGAVSAPEGPRACITGWTQRKPELLAQEIARCAHLTAKRSASISLLPELTATHIPEYIAAIRGGRTSSRGAAGRRPEQLHEGQLKVPPASR